MVALPHAAIMNYLKIIQKAIYKIYQVLLCKKKINCNWFLNVSLGCCRMMKMDISNLVNPFSFKFSMGSRQGGSHKWFEHYNSNLAFFSPKLSVAMFKIISNVNAFGTDE